MRKIFPLTLILLAGCASLSSPVFDDGGLAGEVAQDFKVQSLDGRTDASLSQHKGKVVLLDFWATWCGPCKHAMPEMEELYAKYKDNGLVVMAITEEEPEIVAKFKERHNVKYPLYIDKFRSSTSPYKVNAYPTFIVVGRDGRIVGDLRGYGDGALAKMVDPAMQ